MKNKFIKKTGIIALIILIIPLGLLVFKNIHQSNQLLTINNIIKNNETIIASGNLGSFPILLMSNDNGQTWKQKSLGYLSSLVSSNSHYLLENNGGMIWVNESKPCIECDFSNKVINSYYSNDFGESWESIPFFKSFFSSNQMLKFYNNTEGEIISLSEERTVNYSTIDGGEKWKKGSLDKKPEKDKNQLFKIRKVYFKKEEDKYILRIKEKDCTYIRLGFLLRKMESLD